jgi:small conductance mechanosensitive channel
MNQEAVVQFLSSRGLEFGIKILTAIAAWIIGRWIISLAMGLFRKLLERNDKFDATLIKYLVSIVTVLLTVGLIMGILDIVGVQTASFAALLAGAGLAIGTAWGGLLTHFAAGAFMQILRPFKVGDVVSAGGVTGTN